MAAQRVAVWERHGQTIMLSVITATLIGTASILYASNGTQHAMAAEIRNLTNQVAELRGTVQAMQFQYVSRVEFQGHETRLQTLESRK